MLDFDYNLKGKRIRLLHTDDRYTKLKTGDMGTVQFSFDNLGTTTIAVNWDSGSNLSMLVGKDIFEILD